MRNEVELYEEDGGERRGSPLLLFIPLVTSKLTPSSSQCVGLRTPLSHRISHGARALSALGPISARVCQ